MNLNRCPALPTLRNWGEKTQIYSLRAERHFSALLPLLNVHVEFGKRPIISVTQAGKIEIAFMNLAKSLMGLFFISEIILT